MARMDLEQQAKKGILPEKDAGQDYPDLMRSEDPSNYHAKIAMASASLQPAGTGLPLDSGYYK